MIQKEEAELIKQLIRLNALDIKDIATRLDKVDDLISSVHEMINEDGSPDENMEGDDRKFTYKEFTDKELDELLTEASERTQKENDERAQKKMKITQEQEEMKAPKRLYAFMKDEITERSPKKEEKTDDKKFKAPLPKI